MNIQGMDPEVAQYLLEQFGNQQRQADLDRQMALAHQLRQRSASPGITDTGFFKVAANPLEHLSAAVGQGLAGYQQGQVQRGYGELDKAREAARRRLAGMDFMPGGVGAAPY